MIPSGFNLADVSFDASDPWDASSLQKKELVIFKVPLDFPTLQLSGKKLDLNSTLKIKTEKSRTSFVVEELKDLGELDNFQVLSGDASSKNFKFVNVPIKQYYAIKPKISISANTKNDKIRKSQDLDESNLSKKSKNIKSENASKSRELEHDDKDKKSKKNKTK